MTSSDEDTLIAIYIQAAEDAIIKFLNRTTLPDNGDSPVTLPSAVKAAAMLMVGDLYANRESSIVGSTINENPTYFRLLYPYREAIGM